MYQRKVTYERTKGWPNYNLRGEKWQEKKTLKKKFYSLLILPTDFLIYPTDAYKTFNFFKTVFVSISNLNSFGTFILFYKCLFMLISHFEA